METVIATVISILFSILISIVVTRYYTKIQMKKKEVTHFLINSYDIGKGLKDVFPEFSISYKNEVLAKHVRVYEGCFMNTGNKDVHNHNDNIEIQMAFPKDYIVKAVKAELSPDDLIVNAITGDNSNQVIFLVKELFKTKKRFKYSAIVECPNDIAAKNTDLIFEHKLPDTDIIDGDKLYEKKKRLISIVTLFTSILGFIPGFLSARFIYSPLSYNLHSFKYIVPISFLLAFLFLYVIFYYLFNHYIDSKNKKFRESL